jgi:hypothetical protein
LKFCLLCRQCTVSPQFIDTDLRIRFISNNFGIAVFGACKDFSIVSLDGTPEIGLVDSFGARAASSASFSDLRPFNLPQQVGLLTDLKRLIPILDASKPVQSSALQSASEIDFIIFSFTLSNSSLVFFLSTNSSLADFDF